MMFGYHHEDPKQAADIERKAFQFYYSATSRTFYRRIPDGLFLCCLSNQEAQEVLKEALDGVFGAHQPGPKFGGRISKMGYYWPRMSPDTINYAKRCHACQIHKDFIHQAPGHLHETKAS